MILTSHGKNYSHVIASTHLGHADLKRSALVRLPPLPQRFLGAQLNGDPGGLVSEAYTVLIK